MEPRVQQAARGFVTVVCELWGQVGTLARFLCRKQGKHSPWPSVSPDVPTFPGPRFPGQPLLQGLTSHPAQGLGKRGCQRQSHAGTEKF